jgi:sec-independent protein translocase protein TatA
MILAEIIGPDLLIVLAIVAVLFGGSQLPKLARSLGSAKAEFEKGTREAKEMSTVSTDPQTLGTPAEDAKVTMTRADLDALITEREANS